MNEEEQNETLIVVFIAETDLDYVELVAKEIEIRFSFYVENGLIEVRMIRNTYTFKLFVSIKFRHFKKMKICINEWIECTHYIFNKL